MEQFALTSPDTVLVLESPGYVPACIKLLLMGSTCGEDRGAVTDLNVYVCNIMYSYETTLPEPPLSPGLSNL